MTAHARPRMDDDDRTSASQYFKVPAGAAPNGRLVRARDANGQIPYHCPGCGSPLLLRRGPLRSPHFAHKSHGFCSPETALHQGVKNRIADILQKVRNGRRAGAPRILAPCAGCSPDDGPDAPWRCPGEAWFSLNDLAFDEVSLERSTADGLRPDVLLLQGGRPVLGIEVLVSHAVDPEKAGRTSMPWIELDAMRFLSAPRSWKPCQGAHPWTGQCLVCACLSRLDPSAISEITGPGDYLAQVAAAGFHGQIQAWLQSRKCRKKPAVCWRCPSCRKRNSRALLRGFIREAGMASSLRTALEPQVILQAAAGPPILVSFGFPKNPNRPWAVVPLPGQGPPVVRATPDLKRPHRLSLNGTNRPLAFLCAACGADCIGAFPSPLVPESQFD